MSKTSTKGKMEMYLNKTAVLNYIKDHEGEYITYIEIATATMVPKGCLTTVINELLKEGNIGRGRTVKWWGTSYKVLNDEVQKPQEEKEPVEVMARATETTKRKKRISANLINNLDNLVVDYIKSHSRTTYKSLAREFKASEATIRRVIRRLMDSGTVDKIRGNGKGRTVYFVLNNQAVAPIEVAKPKKVLVAKRILEAKPVNRVSFVLHDEKGNEVINVQGNSNDSTVLGILTNVIGGLN